MSNHTFAIYEIHGKYAERLYNIFREYTPTPHSEIYMSEVMEKAVGPGYYSDEILTADSYRLDADGNLHLSFAVYDGGIGLHGYLLSYFPDIEIYLAYHYFDPSGTLYCYSSSPEVFPLDDEDGQNVCQYIKLSPHL